MSSLYDAFAVKVIRKYESRNSIQKPIQTREWKRVNAMRTATAAHIYIYASHTH